MKITLKVVAALAVAGIVAASAQTAPAKPSWKDSKSKLIQADFPITTACIGAKFPAGNKANKGMAMIVGEGAFMSFDTDLLRFSAGWVAAAAAEKGKTNLVGFISDKGVTFNGSHGGHPEALGEQKFGTKSGPGWADAAGSFADPRKEPFGPLPKSWARWDGHYVVGDKVVLAYTVHGTKIYDQPGSVEQDGQTAFLRTIKIDAAKADLTALILDGEGAAEQRRGRLTESTDRVGPACAHDRPDCGLTCSGEGNGHGLRYEGKSGLDGEDEGDER